MAMDPVEFVLLSPPFLVQNNNHGLILQTGAVFGCLYHALVPLYALKSSYRTVCLRQTLSIRA